VGIGLEELNLFGNATYAAINYAKNPDRSALTLQFRQPRLIADGSTSPPVPASLGRQIAQRRDRASVS